MCGKYINMTSHWTPGAIKNKDRDCDLDAAEAWFYDMINSTEPNKKYSDEDKTTVETLLCEYLTLRLIKKKEATSKDCLDKNAQLDEWFVAENSATDKDYWICFRTMLVHQLNEIYGENITEQDIKDFIHQIIFVDESLYKECKNQDLGDQGKEYLEANLKEKGTILQEKGISTIIKSYCHPNNKSIVDKAVNDARVTEARPGAFNARPGGKLLRKSKKNKKLRRRKSIRRRR